MRKSITLKDLQNHLDNHNKCSIRVYHHCLFGTRYDFLCANYTAFDQKTFICHFASEVDCSNSKRFWHRNDALYQSASTTTSKPLVIPTTPPPPQAVPIVTVAVPSGPGTGQRRPVGRPFRRRRPYYDYYDDYYDDFYYDDRPRSRGRKRPRPRPRPVYEDDYEDDYDDDRYETRGNQGRRNENRRPYNRRPSRGRNKDRPRYDYIDEDDDRYEDEEDINNRRRKPSEKNNKKSNSRRRPTESASEEKEPKQKPKTETRTIIKPVSGTIYDRPRVAPKIKLPVPKSEANKYAYKPISTTEIVRKEEDEYDSYEDEPKPKKSSEETSRKKQSSDKLISSTESSKSNDQKKQEEDYYYDDYDEGDASIADSKEKDEIKEESSFSSKRQEKPKEKTVKTTPSTTTTTTTTTSTTTTTTTTTPKPDPILDSEPLVQLDQPVIIRLVKRPFLPSRGGNPYSARGLQPVGSRAVVPNTETSTELEGMTEPKFESDFKPMPTTEKSKNKEQYVMQSMQTYVQKDFMERRPPQPAKPKYKNPLDINVEDYDVTLNDALNPTLPNLPVRSYPTGFDVSNDYYNNYQKNNRFTPDQSTATATATYVFKAKPVNQRYETPVREQQPVHSSSNFRGYYSVIEDNYRPRQVPNTQTYYSRY